MNLRSIFRRRTAQGAFSLVELTIAIGITAFGGLTMMGLLTVGLSNFRNAVDMSVGAQIVQQVVADVQQSSFSAIGGGGGSASPAAAAAPGTGIPVALPVRYFDDQGTEVDAPGSTGGQPALYHVAVGVTVNASGNLATVVVDIVNNPGGQLALQRDGATGGFASDSATALKPVRYSFYVSKTQ
ncbi:hypothetical protein DB346_07860 [Verrucomicrobia bacterium LW23]|nr:hypothetical protein DB346_07860 [Verrucomicrobia bacterium LW23]